MNRRCFLSIPAALIGAHSLSSGDKTNPGGFGLVNANGEMFLIKPEALEQVKEFPMSTNIIAISGRTK